MTYDHTWSVELSLTYKAGRTLDEAIAEAHLLVEQIQQELDGVSVYLGDRYTAILDSD